MGKYNVFEDKDGNRAAHTESYQKKSGEKKVGTVEAESVDHAMEVFDQQGGGESLTAGGRTQPDSEDAQKTREDEEEELRQAEEDKEEIEVTFDPKTGTHYVEGSDSDPSKSKAKASKAEPLPEPEPASAGTFRVKDEKEAIARAKGEYHDPAEGPARGSQTP